MKITVDLPRDLRERLELLRSEKGWPEMMTPERIAAVAMTRTLYELGAIESSHEACEMAGVPRIAWLALGTPLRDMSAQVNDEIDLWLNTLGERPEQGEPDR